MTVLFSLIIIICGIISMFCFVYGNLLGGFISALFVVLAIVALVGRVMAERGLFGSLAKKKEVETTPLNNTIPQEVKSDADKIKEYKALFEEGTITQEEFEAKKKQILGI